jgi:hypothetical protein
MADYNSVPLGEAGTGAAFILPQESQAANRLLDTLDYNQKIDQFNQNAKHKRAQDLANSYKENAFKAKNGTLYNNELMALQQKHVQQGSEYGKQGIDIYNPNPNDPNQMAAHDQYMSDRAKIYNMQDVRDQLQKHLLDQDELAAKAKPGTYSSKSIQNIHDFYNKNTLGGIVNNGLQAPYLQEAFDPETTILNKAEPVMTPEKTFVTKSGHKIVSKQFMPHATAKNGVNLYSSTPGASDYVQEQTGLTPQDAQKLPDDLNDITHFNDVQFRNTPEGQQALVKAGITSYQDPRYSALLQQKSQADFQGKQKYNSIIKEYVDRARIKANIKSEDVPDFAYNNEYRAQKKFEDEQKKEDGGEVTFGNQESTVPVLKTNLDAKGKIVPKIIGYGKNMSGQIDPKKPITSNSYSEPEQGATMFSQAFPQTKMMATPGSYVDIKTGHSIKNTQPFEVNTGSVRMEPTFTGLQGNDSRNGAVMSKRQLMEAVQGKGIAKLENISFQPMVYGERPVKNEKGKVDYQPVAFPYDAVRGNNKLKTTKFDQTEQQFKELINSPDFKAMDAQQRFDFLSKTFNIK